MRLRRYTDLPAYIDRVSPFLMQREAEHCLQLGILTTLLRGEMSNARAPFLTLVWGDTSGRVALVALATPPFNLILSHPAPLPDAALDEALLLVAAAAHDAAPDLPGVLGPDAVASRYVSRWEALTDQTAHAALSERIYRLERVTAPQGIAGEMRRIEEGDRPILREWLRAFSMEALGEPDDPSVETQIDRRLRFESSGMYLWQVGASPVSLAGYGGPTPHGARIGPVYTPPDARSHGYASALTAALSQTLLDAGRQFVFLFTDLANPTSNHIYQSIGYQPVSDVIEYRFDSQG
ncbi:MAG TPA: GNAT family N-acetyltransferase [Ktedonobacterales bacterium]